MPRKSQSNRTERKFMTTKIDGKTVLVNPLEAARAALPIFGGEQTTATAPTVAGEEDDASGGTEGATGATGATGVPGTSGPPGATGSIGRSIALRIFKGCARYTSGFTPPASAFAGNGEYAVPVVVTLPAAAGNSNIYSVKNVDGYGCTIGCVSGTIDGASTVSVSPGGGRMLVSDGTMYRSLVTA